MNKQKFLKIIIYVKDLLATTYKVRKGNQQTLDIGSAVHFVHIQILERNDENCGLSLGVKTTICKCNELQ
jgi:hypothetical protein